MRIFSLLFVLFCGSLALFAGLGDSARAQDGAPSLEHILRVTRQASRHGGYELLALRDQDLLGGSDRFKTTLHLRRIASGAVQKRALKTVAGQFSVGAGGDFHRRSKKWFSRFGLQVVVTDLTTGMVVLEQPITLSYDSWTAILVALPDTGGTVSLLHEVAISAQGGTNNTPTETLVLVRHRGDEFVQRGVPFPMNSGRTGRFYCPPGQYNAQVRWLDQQGSDWLPLEIELDSSAKPALTFLHN